MELKADKPRNRIIWCLLTSISTVNAETPDESQNVVGRSMSCICNVVFEHCACRPIALILWDEKIELATALLEQHLDFEIKRLGRTLGT